MILQLTMFFHCFVSSRCPKPPAGKDGLSSRCRDSVLSSVGPSQLLTSIYQRALMCLLCLAQCSVCCSHSVNIYELREKASLSSSYRRGNEAQRVDISFRKLDSKFDGSVHYVSANIVGIFPHGENMKVEDKWKKRIMEEHKRQKGRRSHRRKESREKVFGIDTLVMKGR